MKLNILLILLFSSFIFYGQINPKLEEKRGFQDLKLGALISAYDNFTTTKDMVNKFVQWQLSECSLIYNGNRYAQIGDVKIKYLGVGLYEDDGSRISEIKLICDYSLDLINTTITMFGTPKTNSQMDDFESGKAIFRYIFWESSDICLILSAKKYKYEEDSRTSGLPDCVVLHYYSKKIRNKISQKKEMEEKAIQNKIFQKAKDDY